MSLKNHLANLGPVAGEAFAVAAGASLGHLRNVSIGFRTASAELAFNIERESHGAVPVDELIEGSAWKRIPDPDWPHPEGRPLLDFAPDRTPTKESA